MSRIRAFFYGLKCAFLGFLLLQIPVKAEEPLKQGNASASSDVNSKERPAPRKLPCPERSSQEVHHLEDNGGQVALILERSTFSCWPVFSDSKITVRSPSGVALVFSSRTAQRSPGQLSVENSRFELAFPDGTLLELRVGAPVVVPPGLTPEFPGSRFRYKGEELVFTLERPVKPVWSSKEGKAFRSMFPEDAAEVMQALADGRKALREDGVFGDIDDLFVSLYLGQEVDASGRDGYAVTVVQAKYQNGDKVSREGYFDPKSAERSGKGPGAKEAPKSRTPQGSPATDETPASEQLIVAPTAGPTPEPRVD